MMDIAEIEMGLVEPTCKFRRFRAIINCKNE